MGRENKMALWALELAGKYILIFLAFVLYTLLIARGAEAKAARKYEAWQERYVSAFLAQQEAVKIGMPIDPYEAQLDEEAKALAKVLYGIKGNSDKDLRTYCWCVFNRVDSPDYPETLQEVIDQPQQWMRYDPESPVIEHLYNIAREQLDAWHTGETRPISNEYVYMNWTPSDLCLRDNWTEGSRTHYWRYSE